MPKIVLDVNSAEIGIDAVLLDCFKFLEEKPAAELILAGHQEKIQASKNYPSLDSKVKLINAPDTFGMHEHPARVLRNPNNSLARAYQLLASGQAEVMVSSGNSGGVGYLALQKMVHELVTRVAACCNFPNLYQKDVSVCDVGTSTDVKPETLLVYALLLNEELKSRGLEPKIAILNLGEEKGKGDILCKEAYKLFENAQLPGFVGNAEEDKIYYSQEINGFVCSANVGNPILKMAEATHRYDVDNLKIIVKQLVEHYASNPKQQMEYDQIGKTMIEQLVENVGLQKRIGAIILGSEHKIVLSHGAAPVYGALLMAEEYAKRTIDYDKIRQTLEQHRKLLLS